MHMYDEMSVVDFTSYICNTAYYLSYLFEIKDTILKVQIIRMQMYGEHVIRRFQKLCLLYCLFIYSITFQISVVFLKLKMENCIRCRLF